MVNLNTSDVQLVDYQSALIYSKGVCLRKKADLMEKIYKLKPTDIILLAHTKTGPLKKNPEFLLKFSSKSKWSPSAPSAFRSSKKCAIQYCHLENPLSINPTREPRVVPELRLSLKLYNCTTKKDLPIGQAATIGSELAVLVKNPGTFDIRTICRVSDVEGRSLPIKGKEIQTVESAQAIVMFSFTVPKIKKIMLTYLANRLPVVKGTPIFLTRLFVNVNDQKND
ncbi:MAG: hypothetical protein CK425_13120 [Parachlamydia sp.]|nr:MAG: hypothetical protein CK425_13120 [Parachlamydia sp.]